MEFLGIFAEVCTSSGKNNGQHDMKNPGGSNLQFPSRLITAPFFCRYPVRQKEESGLYYEGVVGK